MHELGLRAHGLRECVAVDDLSENDRVDEAEQLRGAGEGEREEDQPLVRLEVAPEDSHRVTQMNVRDSGSTRAPSLFDVVLAVSARPPHTEVVSITRLIDHRHGCPARDRHVRAFTGERRRARRMRPSSSGPFTSSRRAARTVAAPFDRAVALLHSFEFGESIRTFKSVLAADSTCAMAYWGIALSKWTNPMAPNARPVALLSEGQAAADSAARLATHAIRARARLHPRRGRALSRLRAHRSANARASRTSGR